MLNAYLNAIELIRPGRLQVGKFDHVVDIHEPSFHHGFFVTHSGEGATVLFVAQRDVNVNVSTLKSCLLSLFGRLELPPWRGAVHWSPPKWNPGRSRAYINLIAPYRSRTLRQHRLHVHPWDDVDDGK